MNCLPGMWDHGLTKSTILLTCTNSGPMAACWQEQLYYHAPSSQLSAWNKHTLWIPKFITGRSHPEVVFESQWLASQVIVTLVSEKPRPRWASHSKQWHSLGWQIKFTANQVIHGDNHPTHTLHPTPGISYALLHQEGQVPHLLLLFSPTAHSYLPQQFFSSIFLPASEPNS